MNGGASATRRRVDPPPEPCQLSRHTDRNSLEDTSISFDPGVATAIFWVAVACCAIAQVAIVRSAARTASRSAHVHRDGGQAAGVPRPHPAAEVAWTLVPAVMLALVLLVTWRALHARTPPAAVRESSAVVGAGRAS